MESWPKATRRTRKNDRSPSNDGNANNHRPSSAASLTVIDFRVSRSISVGGRTCQCGGASPRCCSAALSVVGSCQRTGMRPSDHKPMPCRSLRRPRTATYVISSYTPVSFRTGPLTARRAERRRFRGLHGTGRTVSVAAAGAGSQLFGIAGGTERALRKQRRFGNTPWLVRNAYRAWPLVNTPSHPNTQPDIPASTVRLGPFSSATSDGDRRSR